MSLKRHPALQPFSRDHLIGLFHAQRLIKLQSNTSAEKIEETIAGFRSAWEREIQVHFADEDRLLDPLPIDTSSISRLDKEHVELRVLIKQVLQTPVDIGLANRVGELLDTHIRWEEHELFPEIENTLSESALNELAAETDAIEKSRHRSL